MAKPGQKGGPSLTNASFGCFPSQSSVRAVSQGDVNKLYFKTSTGEEHNWRTLQDGDRAESFDDVHNMGKKDGKYMKFQARRAPLFDRQACKYTKEFYAKPLGDFECNRMLATTFRGPQGNTAPPVAFTAESSNAESFKFHSVGQMRSAKLPSQNPNPGRTQTLGGSGGGLLVTESSSHDQFRQPHKGMSPAGESYIPKPNLTIAGYSVGEFKSQYGADFGVDGSVANNRTRELMSRTQSAPNFSQTSPGMRKLPNEVYTTRRCVFMSPGM